jgi:peptide/nickel transport system permease protein
MEREKSKMSEKHNSPGREIWRRLRRNKPAIAGLFLISSAFLLALFAYVIIPDQTPFSNRIDLRLGNQSPGFTVQMIKKPKVFVEQTPFFKRIFEGKKDRYVYIPVATVRIDSNKVFYREFTAGDDTAFVPEKSFSVAEIVYALKLNTEVKESGGNLSFITADNKVVEMQARELVRIFIKENLVAKKFYFGTDNYGRDMLSRLIAGTRITLGVGLAAVLISLCVGIFFGSIAGFFGGMADSFVLWLINIIWSVPTLLLAIAITLVLGKGFEQVFIAVGLTMWVDVARIVRGQIMSLRGQDFVSAGKALGFKNPRIIVRHIMPNIIGPVLVIAAANFSTAILLEAGLSFLGIGAQPPVPSWGSMIRENYGYIIIPGFAYLAILPGLAIMLVTMAFTFVANGLRDAIDTRVSLH